MPIRKMEIRDIDKVIELELNTFNETLGYTMLLNEVTKNEVARYYIYEEDNEIVGYLGSWQQSGFAEIVNFLIISSKRQMGYGSKMLEHVFSDMKNNSIEIITLEVRESNTSAINLYEKFDFKYSHRRKEYYANKEDALVLIKKM